MSAAPERLRELMMRALDGEIGEAEQRELERHLAEDPAAATEWKRLTRVKEVTKTMTPRQPGSDVWQTYWTSVYRRVERGVGWILFSIGAIVLLGYGIWDTIESIFEDTAVPGAVRVALLMTLLGLVILLVSVIREKLFVNRNDSYKDITR